MHFRNGNKRHKNQSILIRCEAVRRESTRARKRLFPTASHIKCGRLMQCSPYCRIHKFSEYFVRRWRVHACLHFLFRQSSHIALTLMIIMLIMDLRIHSAHSCCSLWPLFFLFIALYIGACAAIVNATKRDGCACLMTLSKINCSL